MKKMITGMIIGMVIMTAVGFVGYKVIDKNHNAELEAAKAEYTELAADYAELEAEHSELEAQVYNAMEGENYEFDIEHDGENHTYKQSGNGFFKSAFHSILN